MSSLTSSTISLTRDSGWDMNLIGNLRLLRRNPLGLIGLLVVLVWIVIILLAPQIAPADPLKQNVSGRLQAPNNTYPFGSDELGRDMFSRVLYGGRITIPAGVMVIVIGSVIGTVVGAVAGYVGGLWDELLMRLT